jgi:signal peptidase II
MRYAEWTIDRLGAGSMLDPASIRRPHCEKLSMNSMNRWIKIFVFCCSALLFISWDKVSKEMAKEHLKNREPLSYFHDSFRLVYVENTGAAMSLGDNLPKTASRWLLSIAPLIILLILFGYTIRKSKEMKMQKMLALSLIFAGGMGNVMDRLLFDGHVTDFMNVGYRNFRRGIFNFADVCVTAGVLCFLIYHRKTNPSRLT